MSKEEILVHICEIGERLQGQVYSQSTALASNSKWTAESVAAQCQPLQDLVDAIGKLVKDA